MRDLLQMRINRLKTDLKILESMLTHDTGSASFAEARRLAVQRIRRRDKLRKKIKELELCAKR